MKRTCFRRILVIASSLAFLLPCLSLIWLIGGKAFADELSLQRSLRVYPGAEKVSDAQAYYCCDSGRRIQYYWTEDSLTQVENYYETFALPFINNQTIFHPYGGKFELGSVPHPVLPDEEFDPTTDRECHFSQKYSCIQVDLLYFGESQDVNLPDILAAEFIHPSPPSPLQSPLSGGTLIIYSYFLETDMNPFF